MKFLKKIIRFIRERPALRRVLAVGMLGVLGLGLGVVWGSWSRACAGNSCPSMAEFDEYSPSQSVKFYAADGRLIEDRGESRTVVALEEMSAAIPAAFLAIEDKRFYKHRGFDFIRMIGALKVDLLCLCFEEGASTLTQQLARNVFPRRLPSEKAVSRKVREIRVATQLEREFPKERVLELYLNQIFLGGPAHGVEAASQRYFGKSARALNVAEAATLAAMVQRPNSYDPRRHAERVGRRRNIVLNLMRDEGYITADEADRWKAYPILVSTRENYRGVAQYFVEWVRQQVYARFGNRLFTDGYRVYTTLDLDVQMTAEQTLEDQLRAIEARGGYEHLTYEDYLAEYSGEPPETTDTPYLQGAMVTLDTNGYVRAMVGGRNFIESKYNRVTQAERQPGSTFKPFVFSAAVRSGRPGSYIVGDDPISVMQNDSMPWEPVNFDGRYRGPMTMRKGLRLSRNLIAIRLGQELGVSTVVGEARAYGLSTRIPAVESMFIGSAEVLPIEMASAYTAFASVGMRAAPVGIIRVEDADGNIVWEPRVRKQQVMDRTRMWLLTNMLEDVVNRGTGYVPVRLNGGFPNSIPAGGKTGTTNDGSDVWYIGFTPELVTAVWIGFDRRRRIINNAAGGVLAAPAWAAFMKEVYERRPAPQPWARPSSLILRKVDNVTGLLATDFCPRAETYSEWFTPGTEPTQRCHIHMPIFGITGLPGGAASQRHGGN